MRTEPRIEVFTRTGCGCCEKAMEVLERAVRRHGGTIETVDVDSDPSMTAEFGHRVPVVRVDGKVRFSGKVNEVLLERLLQARERGS